MSTIQLKLTATQHAVLAHALEHCGGRIDWFPDNIKGGARRKVLDGLFNRALITTDGTDWFVAAEGYDAMGRARPAPAGVPAALESDPEIEAAVTAAEATWAKNAAPAPARPHTRENSKQAEVIRMLRRPEGVTVKQICEATGWQAHTVRGTFAGAFKKRLGLSIVSDKAQGGERIYRLCGAPHNQ